MNELCVLHAVKIRSTVHWRRVLSPGHIFVSDNMSRDTSSSALCTNV